MDHRPEKASVTAGVKQSVRWIDRLAWIALVFLLSILAARLTSRTEIALVGINLPLAWAYAGILGLTAAHLYISKHIIASCGDAWQNLETEARIALFDDIVRTGGLLTKGAHDYRDIIEDTKHSLKLRINISDTPTWLHHTLVTLTLLAMTGFEFSLLSLSQFCFGFAIVLVNWKIGEAWILCFGDLGSLRSKSVYFLDETVRPRKISHGSGITIVGGHLDYGNFFIRSASISLAWSLLLWLILLIPFFLIYGAVMLFDAAMSKY
jgi:hypothetical protein